MKYIILIISVLTLMSGCGGSSSGSKSTYKTLTLGHDGFDFASGLSGGMCDGTTNVDYEVSDGMTAGWIPAGGSYSTGEEANQDGLTWIHFYNPSTTEYKLVDLGQVSLKSVSDASATWPSINSEVKALILDHVYVIQTDDGYVKFKVTDIKNNDCKTVDVEYEFSTTVSFSNENSSDDDEAEQSLWLGHFGNDFSEGLGTDSNCTTNSNVEWERDDGFLANFTATSAHLEAPDVENGSDYWFHVSETPSIVSDSSDYYLESKGNVALASVTNVSEAWYKRDSKVPSLKVDHVYVIKARDGYVKFKVKEISTAGTGCMNVDYVYSSTSSF